MSAHDEAIRELYQAPLTQFVAERKRLAQALKAAGDRAGADQLLERKRPPISAWVVNQLYWHARDAFDALLAAADKLRQGELAATAAHRDALATLRRRASAILGDAGHAATEAVLRRVTLTLSAIAAAGSFDPDPAGALSADRDPPGFEAAGVVPLITQPGKAPDHRADDEQARRRAEQEHARRAAERERLEAALRTARGDVDARQRQVEKLKSDLRDAIAAEKAAQNIVDDLEARLRQG